MFAFLIFICILTFCSSFLNRVCSVSRYIFKSISQNLLKLISLEFHMTLSPVGLTSSLWKDISAFKPWQICYACISRAPEVMQVSFLIFFFSSLSFLKGEDRRGMTLQCNKWLSWSSTLSLAWFCCVLCSICSEACTQKGAAALCSAVLTVNGPLIDCSTSHTPGLVQPHCSPGHPVQNPQYLSAGGDSIWVWENPSAEMSVFLPLQENSGMMKT